MSNKIAKFEKVSLNEFTRAMRDIYPKHQFDDGFIENMWRDIILPQRSTKRSAGYDFFSPFEFTLRPGTAAMIPTGIRCKIVDDSDYALWLMPKSGIGSKTSIRLSNTIGLIDADYYDSDNEGHIMVKLEMPVEPSSKLIPKYASPKALFHNDIQITRKDFKFEAGMKFIQGIFVPFGITLDDDDIEKSNRNGGMGSTGSHASDAASGDPRTDPNAEPISTEDIHNLLNM